MTGENSKTVVVATIIILGVFTAAFLSLNNSNDLTDTENSSGIAALTISANSTDLLYPELAEASFLFLGNDTWQVSANFMNDSVDWYENLMIYDRNFIITSEELKSIDNALYEGLNQTYPSNTSALALLEQSPHMWYQIEITYTNGSWIFITAFQTELGHIITNRGTGNIDTNLIVGAVLEPLSGLDCLVTAIYTIFSNHLG
jgi:hypothetical protein